MNLALLHNKVQNFIQSNLNTDIVTLILKGSPFEAISIQELAEQIISKKKCEKKLPTWFKTSNIYYPNKLNIEQTSSEITANYKVKLVKGQRLIDLTGGFGVDCLAFSKTIHHITHCEINTGLSEIVQHNFKQIGVNITTFIGDGIDYITRHKQTYDCIYIDPSRRDSLKKRVFLLEDCSPNVPEYLDTLFLYSNTILIKTSPLLDINAAIKSLNFVKSIHVIAINNDVKEVLYLLEKNYSKSHDVKTVNITKHGNQVFHFNTSHQSASYSLPKTYLYEPNAAILKAGAFQEVSSLLNIDKLHKHSHLYTSSNLIDFPGRVFKITHVLPYQPKKIIQLLQIKKANIAIRNFPDTVLNIRKKTKLKEGGTTYLFFTTNTNEEKIVAVCEKIPSI